MARNEGTLQKKSMVPQYFWLAQAKPGILEDSFPIVVVCCVLQLQMTSVQCYLLQRPNFFTSKTVTMKEPTTSNLWGCHSYFKHHIRPCLHQSKLHFKTYVGKYYYCSSCKPDYCTAICNSVCEHQQMLGQPGPGPFATASPGVSVCDGTSRDHKSWDESVQSRTIQVLEIHFPQHPKTRYPSLSNQDQSPICVGRMRQQCFWSIYNPMMDKILHHFAYSFLAALVLPR